MFFAFRSHLIHWLFASNATSCTMQQLLQHYQIPQYDRHHFPVTGILLIAVYIDSLVMINIEKSETNNKRALEI